MNSSIAVSTTALRTFPLFAGLSDDVLTSIARVAAMKRFPRGQAVVREGDVTDFVYFVLTGSLKVVVSNEDGREVILSILGRGELFGEMGMFDDQARIASVVPVVASDLIMIARKSFQQLMHSHSEIAWRITCNLARRLRSADRKIESLALMDVYGRVAGLLLEMSEDIDGKVLVTTKISKQDIARMIGASREMVSRVMKDLSAQGLIQETSRGIILHERLSDL
ncbi:MAG: Crp/Fnr family transcriptional regulator [Azoarcus sp.]|jgi:CRP/FNR family cyclic AMP-dependent transcriptional regulator|nr:Crp/Fnr family transcriptional regulator [Azoarcus sp.]